MNTAKMGKVRKEKIRGRCSTVRGLEDEVKNGFSSGMKIPR